MNVYTGIGSRETPEGIQKIMSSIAVHLARLGWILRSGCASGADSAFEFGAFQANFEDAYLPVPELYLPWPKFEGRSATIVTRQEPQLEALAIAEQFHPRWSTLSQGSQKLHARNVHQILGPDVTNPILSRFVICWTKGAKGGGGTGQALRIAQHYDIPIFDLARRDDLERVTSLFK